MKRLQVAQGNAWVLAMAEAFTNLPLTLNFYVATLLLPENFLLIGNFILLICIFFLYCMILFNRVFQLYFPMSSWTSKSIYSPQSWLSEFIGESSMVESEHFLLLCITILKSLCWFSFSSEEISSHREISVPSLFYVASSFASFLVFLLEIKLFEKINSSISSKLKTFAYN